MMRKVPFFNYPHVFTSHRDEFMACFEEICSRGAFIMQKDLAEFEQALAEYVGSRYAVGVANATDGLQMLLMAGGLQPGDEVIFCSHTMVATASAIYFAGGKPIPVEAGEDHLIDPQAVRQAITSKTKAILPTQLNGRTADMDLLSEIAQEYDLLLFEDSAQALGSKFKGQAAGTFGLGGCISFYPAKILGCLGDGGAVITNDQEVYERLLLLRDHGRGADGEVQLWGFNSRLDNIQAGFLLFLLKEHDQVIKRRRFLAAIYDRRLSGLDQLSLPPAPDADPAHFDVFQNYEIQAQDRDRLRAYLADKGVGTLIQWGGTPVHKFRKLGFTQDLPRTEAMFERLLMLPLNMSLSDEDVHYVCDCIEQFYAG